MLNLTLPADAELHGTKSGGAQITQNEETLVDIPPPIAIDVNGAGVPVEMEVSGDSLILEIAPEEGTEFPVLLDPLFQTYEWNAKKTKAGINAWSSGEEQWSREDLIQHSGGSSTLCNNVCALGQESPLSYELPGLWVQKSGLNTSGDHASWIYTIPRYFTDQAKYGVRPQSFINHMTLSKLHFKGFASANSPYLVAGLWDSNNGWVSLLQHEGSSGHGLVDMAYTYQFPNPNANTNVKLASAGLWSLENGTNGSAHLYVGAATTELAEPPKEVPGWGSVSGPSTWVNQSATAINFAVSDAGLGVHSISVSDEQSPSHTWKTSYGCTGAGGSACPRTWSSTGSGQPALKYEPAVLPQGTNYLTLVAEDPLGNLSTPAKVQVKVDHTTPELVLSGTLTEQAKLGVKHPTYVLKASASDGTEASPQSGAAKTVVKVDGKVVDQASPGCSTKNCAISREWTLDASEYSTGQHTVEVTATDAVGLSTTKSISIELQPAPPPSLELTGTMTEQDALGASRPRYKLTVDASAEAGEKVPSTFSSSFGSTGTGNGQFEHPAGAALDSKGFLWVVDQDRDRIQRFKEGGEYVIKFGASGTTDGKFGRPTDIAIDSKGNFWVTDAGNKRVEVFNEKREYVAKIESAGSAGSLSEAEGIAIAPSEAVWIADTDNGRLLQFNTQFHFNGVFGAAELTEPVSIDIGPEGKVWVVDRQLNRVFTFNHNGELLSQFGTEGSGRREFIHPGAIEVSPQGNVWVADEGNGRVLEFDESGNYVAQFGSPGTGQGEFSFSAPMGIAADVKGHIWVADSNSNRVQRWQIPSYVPTGSGSFGIAGTGNGQFKHPAGIDVAPDGSIWVADLSNHRLQQFNEAGEYQGSFGTYGSKKGEFSSPTDVAIDSAGNFWVANRGNCRIDKFDASHKYILSIDTESKSGQCSGAYNGAEGVAVDLEGDLWVAETYNGRVKEYDGEGKLIRSLYKASPNGPEQFFHPTGIDIGPDGHVWVAESGYSFVSELDEVGKPIRAFGYEGTGNGQFQHPAAIDVDERGNVWVADEGNNRIQEFSRHGEYVAQFGIYGSAEGKFNFSAPLGIATDSKGNLWIADPGNNRVQKWRRSTVTESAIVTKVTLDGDQVDSEFSNCVAEACPVEDEWILGAPETSIGDHAVKVTATDGFGRTTTETLEVEVLPDTTKPTLEVGGELAEAPGGWVEQDSYGLNASANDGGYGVTTLELKIDGKQVASEGQGCVEGGCKEILIKPVNMGSYSGGAHSAEVIAIDGANNTARENWTVNVDPEGHITISEVEDTLEAVEETSSSTTIAPTSEYIDPAQFAEGYSPGLVLADGSLESTDTPDVSLVALDPKDGFTLATPQTTITAQPVDVNQYSTSMAIAGDAVAIAGNTKENVDTAVRPIFDGVLEFQSIRNASAPKAYSWSVVLAKGQELELINPEMAAVKFENGQVALMIAVISAHDALGNSVPTYLSVSENSIVTLTVEHTAQNFVYPVVAGSGWEGGFTTHSVARPMDEQEIKEQEEKEEKEKEKIWQEEQEALEKGEGSTPSQNLENEFLGGSWVSAPEPVSSEDGEASASSTGIVKRRFFHIECSHTTRFANLGTYVQECGNPFQGDPGTAVAFRAAMKGKYFVKYNKKVWHEGGPNDSILCHADANSAALGGQMRDAHVDRCVWWGITSSGHGGASATTGHHITPVGRFIGESRGACGNDCPSPNPWVQFKMPPMAFYLWPDGSAVFHETDCIDC